LILLYNPLNPIKFLTAEASASLESDGIEPELRCIIIAFDVNVKGLAAVTSIKEESVRSNP
jgi:hypothetical protein